MISSEIMPKTTAIFKIFACSVLALSVLDLKCRKTHRMADETDTYNNAPGDNFPFIVMNKGC